MVKTGGVYKIQNGGRGGGFSAILIKSLKVPEIRL